MKDQSSSERFTKTVQDYLKYRPAYPKSMLDLLINECGLTQKSVIADIGSGTGLLAKLFLDYGNIVYGVEPNQAMREAGELCLAKYANFHTLAGMAEATSLASHSVDFITVGTAFHWFDVEKSKREFKRIAKPNTWVVLVWNVRNIEESAFIREYEDLLLEYARDYASSNAIKLDKVAMNIFFSEHSIKTASFRNVQLFNWQGLKGRLLSTSYSLRPEDKEYEAMLDTLKAIFVRHQKNGVVEFLYKTNLYYSHI